MTPHEREQLLELAEQIVLNLRNRLAGIDNLNFPAPHSGMTVSGDDLLRKDHTPALNKEDEPHDQI